MKGIKFKYLVKTIESAFRHPSHQKELNFLVIIVHGNVRMLPELSPWRRNRVILSSITREKFM